MHNFDLYLVITFAILAIIIVAYRIRYVTNRPAWGDAFTYLRVAKEIAKHKRIPSHLSFYWTGADNGDRFTLPPLLMILLSPFSNLPYKLIIHFSFVFDLLISITVYLAAYHIFHCTVLQALLASLICLITPMNCVTSASLTPRPLGLFLFLLFCIFLTLFQTHGNILFFLLSSISIALLLLSQRMITQIVLIVTPTIVICFYMFFHLDLFFIIFSIIVGILIAMLLTWGGYIRIISDHFNRIKLHAKHGDQTKFKKRFGNPLQIIKANPWMFFLIIFLSPDRPLDASLYMIIGYIIGIIVLAEIWILGNGANHIYFSAPLVALALSDNLFSSALMNFSLFVVGLICFFIIIREYKTFGQKHINQYWLECFDFINKNNMSGRIMVLPNISCPPLIYYTQLDLIAAGHGSNAMAFNRLILQKNMSDIRFLSDFIRKNKVNYLLVDTRNYPNINKLKFLVDNAFKTLFRNESLTLLSLEHK